MKLFLKKKYNGKLRGGFKNKKIKMYDSKV